MNTRILLLVCVYGACIVVSELMGIKTITLMQIGGYTLNASVALITFPVLFTINDVIAETCGYTVARSLARYGVLIAIGLSIYTVLVTSLPASVRFAPQSDTYNAIFHGALRITVASIVAFLCAELMDVHVFQKVREKYGVKHLWLRSNVSNIVAQFVDTTVFFTIAFYVASSTVYENILFLASLALPYWGLKCLMSIVETPLLYAGVRWVRTGERSTSKFEILSR